MEVTTRERIAAILNECYERGVRVGRGELDASADDLNEMVAEIYTIFREALLASNAVHAAIIQQPAMRGLEFLSMQEHADRWPAGNSATRLRDSRRFTVLMLDAALEAAGFTDKSE